MRDIVKHPQVEDDEYCKNGQHLFVLKPDNTIYCYNCGYLKEKESK